MWDCPCWGGTAQYIVSDMYTLWLGHGRLVSFKGAPLRLPVAPDGTVCTATLSQIKFDQD